MKFAVLLTVATLLAASGLSEVDPNTIIGTGGVGVGGWIAATFWQAFRKWSKLQDLQEELTKAKLEDFKQMVQHRESEKSHWDIVRQHHAEEKEGLDKIYRVLKPDHTPVQGIPITPP